MTAKTSNLLEAAHRHMLAWAADNGGIPDGYVEAAQADIAFWRSVEAHTGVAFAASMFGQWQDSRLAQDAAHAATCASGGDAQACGCRTASSATTAALEELARETAHRLGDTSIDAYEFIPAPKPAIPQLVFDPLAIWNTAREIVIAHGGSIADAVRDLIDAHRALNDAVTQDFGRPQR